MKKHIFIILLLLIGVSCTDDKNKELVLSQTESVVRFSTGRLSFSDTRAMNTIDESGINEIDIFVFSGGKYLYRVAGMNIQQTGSQYTFEARLKPSDDPVNIYVLANSRLLLNTYLPVAGDDETDVINNLNLPFGASGFSGYLPMYGFHTFTNGIASLTVNHVDNLKLLRAAAAVEISVHEDIAAVFSLESIQAFRANSSVRVVPDELNTNPITTPSIPASAANTVATDIVNSANGTFATGLYIPESEWYTDEAEQISEATCIVIGASFDNQTTSYYRINITNTSNLNIGRILRNHRYRITVMEVSGQGWDTPEEAADNPSSQIGGNIIDWDIDESDVIFGTDGKYMALSSRNILLPFYSGATGTVTVNTNISNYTIEWANDDGTSQGGPVAGAGESVSNDIFTATLAADLSSITVTALSANESTVPRSRKILVSVANIRFTITVTQQNQTMIGYVTVLNLIGVNGDIGDDILQLSPTPALAPGLRGILKSTQNFGLNGTVPSQGYWIAGLNFQINLRPALLETFDVIYIPTVPGSTIDATESNNLKNWIARDNKVLIVNCDPYNNTTLLDVLGYPESSRSYVPTNVTGYRLSASAPADITAGPFGNIPPDYAYPVSSSGQGGYLSASLDPDLIPILIGDNEDQVVVGINKKRKILYCGDFRIYLSSGGGLTDDNGSIVSNNDILVANMGAWIAQTVLSDDYN